MASAQKRGFRLPWGGDVPRDDSDVDGSTAAAVAEPDERVADPSELELPTPDDATEGSFDVPDEILESRLASIGGRATNDAEPEAEAEADEDAPAPERRPVNANRPGITAGWPDTDRRREEAARTEHATSDARPPQASPPDDAPPARGTGAPGAAPAPAAAPATPPRRDNPLVTGLLKAMREAAATARDETIAGFRADVTARVEVVRTEGGTAVAGLRTNADADIVGIREWGKAEMARIRQETEVRIAERREQLAAETEAQGEATEAMLGVLGETVSEFEAAMAAFFDLLAAENDPARLAGLAERMPMPPTLEDLPEPDPAPRKTSKGSRNGRVPSDGEGDPDVAVATSAADDEPENATAGEAATEAADGSLDSDAAAAAEAEAIAGLALPPVPTQSQLVVVGLATVPAIAAFKAELMRIDGVTGVNVTAGVDGDFMFTVAHGASTNLRDAIESMDRFTAHVSSDDGATLSITVEEPQA